MQQDAVLRNDTVPHRKQVGNIIVLVLLVHITTNFKEIEIFIAEPLLVDEIYETDLLWKQNL